MASHAGRTSLRISSAGLAGLRSFSFLGRVGGVNFESVGFLDDKLKDDSVHIDYNPENEDGKRLEVFIDHNCFYFIRYLGSFGRSMYEATGNIIVNPPIYDWQLKPIAEYADSEYSAVVSLFGDGEDRVNNFYIEYHPAFEDTVLGLRLLQADIIMMDIDQLSALPKQEDVAIIEKGEKQPDKKTSLDAIKEIKSIYQDEDIQALVLTDIKYDAEDHRYGKISIENNKNILIDVNHYYYFWRGDNDDEGMEKFSSILDRWNKGDISDDDVKQEIESDKKMKNFFLYI